MEDLKLATSIVTRNEEFSNTVWKKGHTVNFDQTPGEAVPPAEFAEFIPTPAIHYVNTLTRPALAEPHESSSHRPPHVRSPSLASPCESATLKKVSSNRYMEDLDTLIHESSEITQSTEKIIPWLKNIYISSRGFELGTFDPALISLIWKKQSFNWDDLALGYISDVIAIVHCFIRCLIQAICPDERVVKELTSVLMEELVTRYQKAIDQVKFILSVEKAGTPMTLNHYFNENLEKR